MLFHKLYEMSQDMLYYMYVPRRDLEEVPWAKLFEIKKKYYFLLSFQIKYHFRGIVTDVYISL